MPQLVGAMMAMPIIPPKCAPCQVLNLLRPQVHAFTIVASAVSRDTMKKYVCTGSGPGYGELWNKINSARKLVAAREWIAADGGKLNEDFDTLGEAFDIDAYSEDGKNEILATALAEIKPENYFADGAKTSNALATAGMTLWTFIWQSEQNCFGKSAMYVKFCLRGSGAKGPVHIHSLHVDNPPPDEEESINE